MNLFWETRQLTPAREDHLTCFLAAALEIDLGFRGAYEDRILAPLGNGGTIPTIRNVIAQMRFRDERARPDMVLVLDDGRQVACEHKIDATETAQESEDGETSLQLERYLQLPGIDAVAYFRSMLKPPADAVLVHPRYLRPKSSPHYLWRDLYGAVIAGNQAISTWLREGFERLGFTPPVPYIGELWSDKSDDVEENQRNFAKLWHGTRSHLSERWKIGTGSRCELYLYPKTAALADFVYVSPLAQGGSLLRIRIGKTASPLNEVQRKIEAVVPGLPLQPEVMAARMNDGTPCIDVMSSLRLILGSGMEAATQETRLQAQVVPVIDALSIRPNKSLRG